MKDANYWIEHLSLIQHPEGGYYNETILSRDLTLINKNSLSLRIFE